jgi:hypothetical protein
VTVASVGWKVVTQYHSAGEMVYDLASGAVQLEVRISSQRTAGERSWHVAAQPGNTSDAVPLSESSESKASALDKVAAQWAERAAELGLPVVDWPAIAAALLAVRAI